MHKQEIDGHKVVRKREYTYQGLTWYYVCQCGHISAKKITIVSARKAIDRHLESVKGKSNA